ncbi:(Fe-S)-binding protein [Paraburkholderia sp.]|uniref:(Fe-S)-binding protein n=1 Tax=Paraburkholderia sp. TaxID=1926495 RepID=UPI003C7CB41F
MTNNDTRVVFDGLPHWSVDLFYVIGFSAIGIFAVGCWRLISRYRKTRTAGHRPIHVGRMLSVMFSHSWISRRATAVGVAHAGVFFGFLMLFIGTSILTLEVDIARPLGLSFWHGTFYRIYSFVLDLFGAIFTAGLIYFIVRRARKPFRLDYARADGRPQSKGWSRFKLGDAVFTWTLLFIAVSGFSLEALRIAASIPYAFVATSPVGSILARCLVFLGIDGRLAQTCRFIGWWIHGLVALSWIASIPYTKAMHMLTGPTAITLESESVSKELPEAPSTGYAALADFSPTHRVNLDACTKCGRCHEACPARTSGMPLSPRDLVLDLRLAQESKYEDALIPGQVSPDAIWSCMQCNACVEICPVGIEHVPIINLLRRAEVEKGNLQPTLAAAFEKVLESGNSFGLSKRQRSSWAKEIVPKLPDARKEAVDVLWFVGDYASFDKRNKQNTEALAKLLIAAGVDVGILYDGEKTAGNDIRRAGEEGLFQNLVASNIETINKCSFNRILTSDPHSFNTLRNEYPSLGAKWAAEGVVHHSVFLLELIERGKLTIRSPNSARVTYHDPCMLGRYNGIFEQPRELIRRLGHELIEMPRNRDNSFCCGAGGGRIWMKDTAPNGSVRPSHDRIHEASQLEEIEYFVVACPKDVVMYEEAIGSTGKSGVLKVKEISELVLEATECDGST